MTLEQVGRELAAIRVISYGDRDQRPFVPNGGIYGGRALVREDVGTDTDGGEDQENSNDFLWIDPVFHWRYTLGAGDSLDRTRKTQSDPERCQQGRKHRSHRDTTP